MKKGDKKGLSLVRNVENEEKIKKSPQNKQNVIEFFVTFLGVRGTTPTPHKKFLKYGGNTSCIKITSVLNGKTTEIIFDAGTGIINFADKAISNDIRVFHLFLSHMHYDHMIGLTKFAPIFRNDCEINIYGQSKLNKKLPEIIQNFFSAPFFPLEYQDLPCVKNIKYHDLNGMQNIQIENLTIEIQPLNHPQGALAYKVWNADNTKSVVYATDHEHGTEKDEYLKEFIKDTDLFIYDSTYSKAEYIKYTGWGHSTAEMGAYLAKAAKVKNYAIFHHDPSNDDKFLEKVVLLEAKKIFKHSFLAKENLTVYINPK